MDEIEKKVNAMIGKSTMNEYKAYKNLVKHKRRINRVFSKVCSENSFRLSPGHCCESSSCCRGQLPCHTSEGPQRKSSKKGRGDTDETSSSTIRPEKTRSLESSKRKRKSSEVISVIELQAASSLAQLSRKKTKKAIKKIAVAEVRCVPSAFDDDMIVKPSHKGFFSCLWPDLRFDVRRHCTPGSENEFVDVETFSDDAVEVQKEVATPTAAAAEAADP
jgi:hypothetical protein